MVSRYAAMVIIAASTAACGSVGALGDVLGGVLPAPSNQMAGTVQGVDTRSQQVFVRQSDGQTIAIGYDTRTQVVYQNQNYEVTALEHGDQVNVRVQDNGNSGYYTDLITVTSSTTSSSSGNTGNEAIYSLQGTVRSVDRSNGWFTISAQNGGTLTVSLPYNVSSTDIEKFRNLRSGDYVRIRGVYLNDTRVELRGFN